MIVLVNMRWCLLLTDYAIKSKQEDERSKPNRLENYQQTMDQIKHGLDTYEINKKDLEFMIYMLNNIHSERIRKQTVYWYTRQG